MFDAWVEIEHQENKKYYFLNRKNAKFGNNGNFGMREFVGITLHQRVF